jgi:hypothetical protein
VQPALSLKSFGRVRTVPDGGSMRTTRLKVVKGYGRLKLGNHLMKKNYFNERKVE